MIAELLAHLAGKTHARLDDELHALLAKARGEGMELVPLQHHAKVRHRHVVAVHRIRVVGAGFGRAQMGNDLVAEEVEVDPFAAAAAFRAAEHAAVKRARTRQVVDREGKVKRRCSNHGAQHTRALGSRALAN